MVARASLRYAKGIIGIVAMGCVVLALVLFMVSPSYRGKPPEVSEHVKNALAHIREQGVTPELQQMLIGGAKPRNWVATYVVRQGTSTLGSGSSNPLYTIPHFRDGHLVIPEGYQPDILASAPPELREQGLTERYRGRSVRDLTTHIVEGPDGERYEVNVLWSKRRIDPYLQVRQYAFLAALAAWILVGVWIAVDAKTRDAGPIVAWLWLGIIGGPISLAVWLTIRPPLDAGPHHCLGCGAVKEKGTVHCVRCGYALLPTCPTCSKPVNIDWDYCGQCGTSLTK